MKYERINKKYTKIIIGFIVIIIIGSVLVLNITKAKYRKTISIPIVSGTIKYTGGNADLNVIAMYKPKNEDQEGPISDWDILTEVPGKGYSIDEDQTKCTIGGEEDTNKTIKIIYDGTSVIVTGLTKPKTKCNIYFIKKSTASDTIVANSNLIEETPDFSKTACSSCTDNKSGLYKEDDDFGESYYFRGTVNDNWAKFGNMSTNGNPIWWRIIRINGDGSIRLIYMGNGDLVPNTKGTQTNAILNQAYNTLTDNNMYVGYGYQDNDQHGRDVDSDALIKLNNWFSENLLDEWDEGNGSIDPNAGFCNDRSGSTDSSENWNENTMEDSGGKGKATTYYGGYLRLSNVNKQPTFKCSTKYNDNKDSDYFTYKESNNIKIHGTQSLNYPIGLITADEVAFAGSVYNQRNTGYWLYTGEYSWTMTPNGYYNGNALVFVIHTDGSLTCGNGTNGTFGLRPVINLKATTEFTFLHPDQSNKGTSSNPYIFR